ncbi:MAG: uncharacterized protein A8A55_2664 [Amphiamblys sp. WSBS2006]|nr:MAG: uncharacterized protein A8A55_2664 [Amphiamblys sp. WSBS2006]
MVVFPGWSRAYYCLCEIRRQCGKQALGSVYIPGGTQTAALEALRESIARLAAKKGSVLLGGDWSMNRKKTLGERDKKQGRGTVGPPAVDDRRAVGREHAGEHKENCWRTNTLVQKEGERRLALGREAKAALK